MHRRKQCHLGHLVGAGDDETGGDASVDGSSGGSSRVTPRHSSHTCILGTRRRRAPVGAPIGAIVTASGIRVLHRAQVRKPGCSHQGQTHRHSLYCIIFILTKMSNWLTSTPISTCGFFVMKKGNGPGGVARRERLQIMLSPEELRVVDSFRFEHRMPSRAAAVRELFRLGIAAAGAVADNIGIKSSDYGVLKAPKNLTKLR
jgi:hypothetical protein